MAIYHNTVKSVCPSKGGSVVASSSYITGEKRVDERTGEIHDYTRKGGVVHSEVLLYENAPPEYADGKNLWNAVSKVEGQNGRTAKAPEMSLPRELSREEQIALAKEAVQEFYVKDGRCAEFAIHDKGDGNPHVHVLVTTRPIDKNGQWEYKTEKVYICKNNAGEEMELTGDEFQQLKDDGWEKQKPYYKDGNPKKKPVYLTDYEKEHNDKWKDYQRVKGKNDPLKAKGDRNNPVCDKWNSPENLTQWREFWAKKINRELEKKNIPDRVDHRSLKDQGIVDRLPQKHIGVHANAREKRGNNIQTDQGDRNRAILEINADLKQIKADHAELYKQTEQFMEQAKQAKQAIEARNKAHEGIGEDITARNKAHEPLMQPAAPISEPTRPPIVQQPQPKTLGPVRKEVGNGRNTLSVDDWKREVSQAKEVETAKVEKPQSRTLQELKTEYDQARKEWGSQYQAIEKIKSELSSETNNLEKYKALESQIGKDEEKLGQLSRFNPRNWSNIKTLEQTKESAIEDMQKTFGETTQEHIEQRITQLEKEKRSMENKMPELNTHHKQAKDAFDQRHTELKALSRQKDLDKSKDMLERYKAGEDISDKDKQLINTYSKELGVKKIEVKNQELGRSR